MTTPPHGHPPAGEAVAPSLLPPPKKNGFESNGEHLRTELALLDLRIREEILRLRPDEPGRAEDSFQGLAISQAEVFQLLRPRRKTRDGVTNKIPVSIKILAAERKLDRCRRTSIDAGTPLALAELSSRFGLSRIQERCVIVALAPEMERRYQKLFGYLHDDVTAPRLSVELAIRLSSNTSDEAAQLLREFAGGSPLLQNHLISLHDETAEAPAPLAAKILKLDPRIVRFLLDDPAGDEGLESIIRRSPDENASDFREWWPAGLRESAVAFGGVSASEPGAFVYFQGASGAGMQEAAAWLGQELRRPLLVIDADRAQAGPLPWSEMLWRVRREAKLTRAVVCFEHFDALRHSGEIGRRQRQELMRVATTIASPVIFIGHAEWKLAEEEVPATTATWEFALPSPQTRQQLWKTHLNGDLSHPTRAGLADLAATFRVTPGQIKIAAGLARQSALRRTPHAPELTLADLAQGCYAQTNDRLDGLARRLVTDRGWKDLVLPPQPQAQLRAIAAQMKYRDLVYGPWGFGHRGSRGCGLNVLFYGSSGTGKTLAAEVLANDLGLALYRIDLSAVVSKYIGETEKNLERIFREAHAANAILLFDEADALFGRRSEVKDAHDRYANIEIGYLLQRMEEFDGMSILTTNLRKNLDDAFVRRLQFIVEFPFPDDAARLRIWRSHLPPSAPRATDLDLPFLAERFKLSGGHIRNIAVRAAFTAAAAHEPIGMCHFVRGVHSEFQKIGRTCSPAEFGPYASWCGTTSSPVEILASPMPEERS
jgi:hypothetical protein